MNMSKTSRLRKKEICWNYQNLNQDPIQEEKKLKLGSIIARRNNNNNY
jgi:hypothetical protein